MLEALEHGKVQKRQSQKLEVQYENCNDAVERSTARLEKKRRAVKDAQAEVDEEEAKLAEYKADLKEILKQCKEQYDRQGTDQMDTDAGGGVSPERSGGPEQTPYGGSDSWSGSW